ncbi:hypothetical protein ABC974_17100 [Sphingomonas oligophenolica]|uniref:Uncharacterized protein n=1 Tax=Sphingomonas oligophenolica TaxID=301154 RepID=A0ABU9Y6C7_9SPHN
MFLKRLDVPADRALRHPQFDRGADEILVTGSGVKDVQFGQRNSGQRAGMIHAHTSKA